MRIQVEPNVPDAKVIGAIVVIGAGIVLAISALRLGVLDPRPASPLDAPTFAPTAIPTIAPVTAPTSPIRTSEPGANPVRTLTPVESPLPNVTAIPGQKTPDLPPPGYIKPEQN